MIEVFGKEFEFSAMNADDIRRVDKAAAALSDAQAEQEQRMRARTMSMAECLRAQCRILEQFLDDVLGRGAAARLGLNGSDLGRAMDAIDALTKAVEAERTAYSRRLELRAAGASGKAKRRRKRRHAHG